MNSEKALVVVDIQKDFMPGGGLPVPKGYDVIPVANKVMDEFHQENHIIVASQDWHPEDHGSFASNHIGKEPMDTTQLDGREQILWPDHCIQGSKGAEFVDDLDSEKFHAIFRKGQNPLIDSYSALYDNGHERSTGLASFLKGERVSDVYVLGVATDVCVKFTALDALRKGFRAHLIEDGCRGVETPKKAKQEMKEEGVNILNSKEIYD